MSKRPIQPFAQQGEFITMHRVLFDEVMPLLSPNAWKVLCLIVRKTIGWQKEFDVISYSQIMRGTGIRSRPTVREALQELRGFMPARDGGRKRTGGWVRVDGAPELIIGHAGEKRLDGTREPSAYSLNADCWVEPQPANPPKSAPQSSRQLGSDYAEFDELFDD